MPTARPTAGEELHSLYCPTAIYNLVQRAALHAVIPEAPVGFLATETACTLMMSQTLCSSVVAIFLFPFNNDAANLTPCSSSLSPERLQQTCVTYLFCIKSVILLL